MPRTLSEFHYSIHFIDAAALASEDKLHEELFFKLGLPDWYGRNWDALLDCMSSIDDPTSNLCAHWEFRTEKRMVLRIRGAFLEHIDPGVLLSLAHVIAEANNCLKRGDQGIRIWIEFLQEHGSP